MSLHSLPVAEFYSCRLLRPMVMMDAAVSLNLTTKEEMTDNKTTEPTVIVSNPKLPKHLCTNIVTMPTKLDVPTPPFVEDRGYECKEEDHQEEVPSRHCPQACKEEG